ncbi:MULTISPECIES: MBL fold metallo-hydrolase [Ramlibacter]|uniref:MBL fold metallo-hydrolase n=1 Tax=Ramlibacter aquaticus TaxID=2780094 RepID=A0ABR9SDL9_9BURK|nr:MULTISPECIES: MBL fold metallo-hydrolase [Ramlibacter]MBE7940385.1 MBL fold metallo-hydrolase [Ramlibacter aquaticus]
MSRSFRASLLASCLFALGATALPVQAAAPFAKTQAPGFYRMPLGDFEITALSDGTVKLPVLDLLKGDKARETDALRQNFQENPLETSVNGYLVNTGKQLVLIDTGAAGLFGPTLGNLLKNLRASGYRPEQVDQILITHMHPDHVGGLMAGARRAFPNATLHIDKHDTDYWLAKANLDAAPADAKGFFQGAMASVNPYVKAGKLKTFDGPTEILPGISAQPAYGHTPGHTVYTVESKGQRLVLWGDLMHVAAVQFTDPTVTIAFDTDTAQAEKAREQAYADAARDGNLVAGAHLAFPGIGHLRAIPNKGYAFIPVNYSGLK